MSVLFIPAVVPKFHDHEMMSKLLGVVNDSSINGVDNPSQTRCQVKSAVGLQLIK